MKVPVVFKEWELTAFLAGLTAFTYYAFGALPLHIAVSQQLGLSPSQTSSWVFIVWFNGAVWSIFLSLYYRQPIPITWTVPGLIYLGTLAGQFSFAEIIGGNLMAGVLILVLALMRMGERIMKWLPLPIVMGMFAGSIFIYVTRTVSIIVEDLAVAGVTVAGYLLGRFIGSRSLPPVALAVICGSIAVGLSADLNLGALPLTLPRVGIPEMQFSFAAFIAISLPLVVLAMGLGNVQGLGFLLAQGYPAPINVLTVVTGICSIVNAVFGGHPATVARIGVALLAGPEAGPPRSRYWGGRDRGGFDDNDRPGIEHGRGAGGHPAAGLHHCTGRRGHSLRLSGRLGKGFWGPHALRGAHGLCRGGHALCHSWHHLRLLGDPGRAGWLPAGRAGGVVRLLEGCAGGLRAGESQARAEEACPFHRAAGGWRLHRTIRFGEK